VGVTIMLKLCASLLAVAGLLFGSSARADEEDIPLDKIPAKVKDAVKAKFPEAVLMKASKEVEDGVVLYEVGINNKGQIIEVTVNEGGQIVEVEAQIDPRSLPRAVTDALMKKYGSFRFHKAEDIVKGDKKYFEVLIEHAGGAKYTEVQIDKDGKILEEEDKTGEKMKSGYAPQRRFVLFGRSRGGCCCCGGGLFGR
jgi:Putative beta-lactamase-inhibitor-like, PepSY-like